MYSLVAQLKTVGGLLGDDVGSHEFSHTTGVIYDVCNISCVLRFHNKNGFEALLQKCRGLEENSHCCCCYNFLDTTIGGASFCFIVFFYVFSSILFFSSFSLIFGNFFVLLPCMMCNVCFVFAFFSLSNFC